LKEKKCVSFVEYYSGLWSYPSTIATVLKEKNLFYFFFRTFFWAMDKFPAKQSEH